MGESKCRSIYLQRFSMLFFLQIRVAAAFPAHIRGRTMTRIHLDIVLDRLQPIPYRIQNFPIISTGQISPANTASKKRIATEKTASAIEANSALGMSRGVNYLQ